MAKITAQRIGGTLAPYVDTENGTISGTLPAGRHHLPLEAVADWTPLYLLDAAGDVVRVNAAGQRDPAGDPVLDIDKLLEEPPTLTPLPSYSERVSDAVDATNFRRLLRRLPRQLDVRYRS